MKRGLQQNKQYGWRRELWEGQRRTDRQPGGRQLHPQPRCGARVPRAGPCGLHDARGARPGLQGRGLAPRAATPVGALYLQVTIDSSVATQVNQHNRHESECKHLAFVNY